MTEKTIVIRKQGQIWILEINRPEVQNKLSILCMEELKQALEEASADAECRAVVLAGGREWFCAGGDLGDYRKKTVLEIKEFGKAFIELHLAMQKCCCPIIAAVEGKAYGGGCSLAEACDLAVASENAEFAVPEILDGLAPAMGFSGLFSNLRKKEAMSMALLGEKLDAFRAKELGLVNRTVPKGEALSAALELAGQLSDYDPLCVRLFKEMYADMGERAYENRLKTGQAMMIAMFKAKGEEDELI